MLISNVVFSKRKDASTVKRSSGNSLLDSVLAKRGFTSVEDAEPKISNLCKPDVFEGIGGAAEILSQAIVEKKKIVIFGDYDVDGCTSICTMIRGIRMLGWDAEFCVPHRIKHGYGLTSSAINEIVPNDTDLLITVDCGITSVDEVESLRKRGVDVVVTDHHLPRADNALPNANAIVNPRLFKEQNNPLINLAGCGVAFYLIAKTKEILAEKGALDPSTVKLARLLDLVAIGTLADMVKLDANNRVICKSGLDVMRSGMASEGVKVLLELAKVNHHSLCAEDITFKIAPAINAAGRLEDITSAIKALLCGAALESKALASGLFALNDERKSIESDMWSKAECIVKEKLKSGGLKHGIIIHSEEFHEGVVGILASRIKDKYGVCAVCLAPSQQDPSLLKGSGRGVKELHIKHDVFDRIACEEPDLIAGYGGHAFALGLSIKAENIDRLIAAYDDALKVFYGDEKPQHTVSYDKEITSESVDLKAVESLSLLEPYGMGFDKPTFKSRVNIVRSSKMGDGRHFRATVKIAGQEKLLNAVSFSCLSESEDPPKGHFDAVYSLSKNTFNGKSTVQMIIEKLKPV